MGLLVASFQHGTFFFRLQAFQVGEDKFLVQPPSLGTWLLDKDLLSVERSQLRLIINSEIDAIGDATILGYPVFADVEISGQAAWALQGKYMGTVRPLSLANRARVKKIREAKGVAAAIAAARKMTKA